MHTIEVSRKFAKEEACVEYLEAMRWADDKDMVCRKCGLYGKENFRTFTTQETTRKRVSRKTGKVEEKRVPARRLHECKGCGRQMHVKNDTVFGFTHIPLGDWFASVALMLEAKKGMSAMQVCRHLGIDPKKNYKSVWYLCHRIREAMIEAGILTGTVEVDHTYLTPKKPRKGRPYVKKQDRDVILGMIERGGRLRMVPVKDAKIGITENVLDKHVSPDATLHTDEHPTFTIIGQRKFAGHRTINHNESYAWGDVHTNTVENAFSLLKRGIYGTYHRVSIKHLGRYCNEFSYRFNRRDQQEQMFHATINGLLKTKPLHYKELTASEELSEPSIPSDPEF
jgi:hypothetical protein